MDNLGSDRDNLTTGTSPSTHGKGYAEVGLQPSENWLRVLLDNTSDVIMVLGADGTIRYVSPAVETVLGYPADEVVGTMGFDYVDTEDVAFVAGAFAEIIRVPGVHTPVELRARGADGSLRHVEAVPNNQLANPVLRGVVLTFRDLTQRVRAEEEARFQARLLDAVGQAIIATDRGGRITYWNRAAEESYGWSAEEALGRSVMEIALPAQSPRQRKEIMLGLREGRSWSGEFELRRKDGTVFPAMVTTTPALDERENLVGIIGISSDITERKEAEEKLSGAEARYRTLVEQIPAVIYVDTLEGVGYAGYTSPQAEAMLGYSLNEWTADPLFWVKLLHPHDRERVVAENVRANAVGESLNLEYRMIAEDGRVVWIRDESVVLHDDSGQPWRRQGVLLDITERVRAEKALREAEERYRTLIEQIPAVTYIDRATDGSDEPLYTSPQIEEMLGYTPEEWLGGGLWPERLHPDDKERVLAADECFEAGAEERFSKEYRLIARDGSVVWVREEAVALKDERGKPLLWQGVIFDITERKEAEEKLREAEERYRTLVERIPAIVYFDEAGEPSRTTYVSPQNETILGYPPEEVLKDPHHWLKTTHPDDHDRVLAESRRTNETGEPFRVEYRQFAKDGRIVWLRDEADLVRDEEGRPLYWLGVQTDITERKALEGELRRQALHDRLTDLPNRKLFVDRLRHALERTTRKRRSRVAVLFMDLDGFKVVNDSLGHEAGDLLLAVAARRLRGCLRPEDTLARFGGDEFVVLIEDVEGHADAVRVAERIIDRVKRPFVLEGRELFVSISIGIALGDAQTKSPENLLRDADMAMYRAKQEGSGYRVFDQDMYGRAVMRLHLRNDLRRAVEREDFVLHYQPIVSLHTGSIIGVEALVRWKHPERGLLAPSEFIPISEEIGAIVPLGRWVLREACRQSKEWTQRSPKDPPLSMSVNLSARQLYVHDIVAEVADILEEIDLDPRSLILEIAESALVEHSADIAVKLRGLKDLGVRLAIDDFGTGYSSLSYLKHLPVDRLKIDRTLVSGLGTDRANSSIVMATVALGHALGIEVAAEGVETTDEFDAVRNLECDIGQGYYWWDPRPSEDTAVLVASNLAP